MPIVPGDQLSPDQKLQVWDAYKHQTERTTRDWEAWVHARAFHFTRKGSLIVERGIYLRVKE